MHNFSRSFEWYTTCRGSSMSNYSQNKFTFSVLYSSYLAITWKYFSNFRFPCTTFHALSNGIRLVGVQACLIILKINLPFLSYTRVISRSPGNISLIFGFHAQLFTLFRMVYDL